MCVVASVRFWAGLTPGEVLQDAEAQEDRADSDPQRRDAVLHEPMMKVILEVQKAGVEGSHATGYGPASPTGSQRRRRLARRACAESRSS